MEINICWKLYKFLMVKVTIIIKKIILKKAPC